MDLSIKNKAGKNNGRRRINHVFLESNVALDLRVPSNLVSEVQDPDADSEIIPSSNGKIGV